MQTQQLKNFRGKRRARGVFSVALTFLLGLTGMAGIAAPANAAPIPSSKVSVTFENVSSGSTPTSAWDWFKFTVNLDNLDGLPAGDTTVVAIDRTLFGGMRSTTLFLNSDGTSSVTSQDDSIAQMDVDGPAGTLTFTLTDYASTHVNVSAYGYITAQINSTITRGETQPISVTIDGITTPIGEVEVPECGGEGQDSCPSVPTRAAKWGGDNGDETGTITITTPVFENATDVKVVDTLTSGSQSINGVNWVRAYNCVTTWGNAGLLDDSNNCASGSYFPATYVPDGDAGNSWILSTDLKNAFLRINLKMTFTGSGPWTDTATITKDGEEFIRTATVRKYDAGGGGYGEFAAVTAVTPVVPTVNLVECTVEDQGTTVWETVTQPENGNGITYGVVAVDGDHVATLTATAEEGFVLDGDALGEGWELNEDGTATWTKQLTSKDCAPAPVVKPTTPGLAATGSTLPFGFAGGAAVLLLAGLTAIVAAKRRHANQQ